MGLQILAQSTLGVDLKVEVIWPTVAKSSISTIEIYAQTQAGRDMVAQAADANGTASGAHSGSSEIFDTDVPGTIAIPIRPGLVRGASYTILPDGFATVEFRGSELGGEAIDLGVFATDVKVTLGDTPRASLVGRSDVTNDQRQLFVTADDAIHIGFKFEDREGQTRWMTQTVTLNGASTFDIFDRNYSEKLESFYVGETAYLRVIDPTANTSGEKDRITLAVQTASGQSIEIEAVETLSHSGIFQTSLDFAHQDSMLDGDTLGTLPVAYGDDITFRYGEGSFANERVVSIERGSDAAVATFTKRFENPDMAMSTMFSTAEAYFELAKQHRALSEEAESKGDDQTAARLQRLVRESIDSGKRILEEAIRDFPDAGLRAQADYLLAELDLEFAKEAVNEDEALAHRESALGRFSAIVGNYPDSEYAPRAQYKRALTYEMMGEMESASAEYVKLSFRYPNHELVADSLSRLGAYFQAQATKLFRSSRDLIETDPPRSLAQKQEANELFTTAGNVFSKLPERFPDHPLGAKSSVAAGVCFKWGEQYEQAILLLEAVTNDAALDNPSIKAEALYWLGDTYVTMSENRISMSGVNLLGRASLALQQCSVNYPETIWAKRSRGLLETIEE